MAGESRGNVVEYIWEAFTPTVTLVGGGGNVVPQYTNNNGRYLKVGKSVFAIVELFGDGGNEGAGTGALNIALPIQASPTMPAALVLSGLMISMTTGGPSTWNTSVLGVAVGGTTFVPYGFAPGSLFSITGDNQANTDRAIYASFFYPID